ncbi:MAG: 4Fe-4S binding protein [Alistipes sp.]|nr:4Fe-4S binding protein [Alistipes sp.]
MNALKEYIVSFFSGLGSLLTGMGVTIRVFFRKKTTEQYPENRETLQMFDRFRGELTLIHNDRNEHHCIACGICQMNCPNGSIRVISQTLTDEEGKKKRVLDQYIYDIGSCLYCQLCVRSCPHDAITFDTQFEHAVFTRSKLVRQLNHPGSTLEVKPKPVAPKPVVPKAESPKVEKPQGEAPEAAQAE